MKYITPLLILITVSAALIRRREIYTDFTDGAADGLKLLTNIFPPLVAVLVGTAMLRASGALDALTDFLSGFTDRIGLPAEVMPLIIIRPLSGSGSIGVVTGILNRCGADSFAGRLASVICGSTETTFYCLAVYLAKTRVKHIAKAIPCAVIGDIAGIAAALIALRVLNL